MKSCNYYVTKEDAEEMESEIRFITGKTGMSEEKAIELIKIRLLSDILLRLNIVSGEIRG